METREPRASPESGAQWMASGLLEFPRIVPGIINCTHNNLVYGSGWASKAKGMGLNRSVSGSRKIPKLLIRKWSRFTF